MRRTVTMTLERETKGALRYRGIADDDPMTSSYLIGTLYLRKAAVCGEGSPPEQINVTVEGA